MQGGEPEDIDDWVGEKSIGIRITMSSLLTKKRKRLCLESLKWIVFAKAEAASSSKVT